MKKKTLIPLIIICILGLLLITYPLISTYYYNKKNNENIDNYQEVIKTYDEEKSKEILDKAYSYNKELLKRKDNFKLDKNLKEKYDSTLNLNNDGTMGYLEIPKIDVKLPIIHDSKEETLSKTVGHLKWSSLPVGGESTHAVLSTHNGLITNRLFTDLWKLQEGDRFTIYVLNERLVYEVDQIKTVLPTNYENLYIEEGKDLVTLITCTPYGINTHRLLVRGHRIDDNKEFSGWNPNGYELNKFIQAAIMSIIPLLIFITIIIIKNKKTKKKY